MNVKSLSIKIVLLVVFLSIIGYICAFVNIEDNKIKGFDPYEIL